MSYKKLLLKSHHIYPYTFALVYLYIFSFISCTNQNTVSDEYNKSSSHLNDTIKPIGTDKNQLKSEQSKSLLKFESNIIPYSEEEKKLKIYRHAKDFYVVSKKIIENKLLIELIGIQGGGEFKGNIEINNNQINLYYWFDETKDMCLCLHKHQLLYTINAQKLTKESELKISYLE